MSRRWIVLTAANAAMLVATGGRCEAAGWWNMPTSLRQCLGYGFGPGYHAPMLMTPPCNSNVAAQGVIYRVHAPKPGPCSGGFCGEMTALGGYGHFDAPAHLPGPTYYQAAPSEPTLAPPPSIVTPVAPTRPPGMPVTEPPSPSDARQPEPLPLPPPSAYRTPYYSPLTQ